MTYEILDHDGFDAYAVGNILQMWPTGNGTTSLSMTTGRFGTDQALRNTDAGTDNYIRRNFPNGESITEFALGFALRVTSASSSSADLDLCHVLEASARHLGLRLDTAQVGAKDLFVMRGGTSIATIAAAVDLNVWNYFVLVGKVHDTTGYWYVYKNGVLIGSATGVDTRNAGTNGNITAWGFGHDLQAISNAASYDIDDCYIASLLSGAENPGDLRETTLIQDGAGNYSQWTPSAGSNYQNVDETAPDGDTTYNLSSSVGNKDSMTMANLPGSAANILSVRQWIDYRKADAGARSIRQFYRISGTDYEQSGELAAADTYTVTARQLKLSPASSAAWSQSEIEAMETGYKDQA